MNLDKSLKEFTDDLKNDERVKAYREIANKIENDEAKKKMIQDFRQIQFEAYKDKMDNNEVSENTKKKLENLVGIISLNPDVQDFLKKEEEFSILFDTIMNSINQAIGIDIIGS